MATGSGTGTAIDSASLQSYDELQGIRTIWREATGLSGIDEIADSTVDTRINNFLTNTFILDIVHDSLSSDFTQAVTVDDDGEYSLASTVLEVSRRATFNSEEISQYNDKDAFFRDYPDEEDYLTNPTLVIGTSSAAAVKNSAFAYEISGWTYTKASDETALSGNTVPQSKYGAWMLSLNASGTVTITEAADNATGYATAALAVDAINTSVSGSVMGFVTAINTSGTFIPGTTELSASGVSATFTDGNPGYRSTPSAFYIDGRTLYLRPKSNDGGLFKARLMYTIPTELSSDSSTVFDEKWGQAIAIGDAAAYWSERGDIEKAQQLTGNNELPGTYKYLITRINREWYKQQRSKPTERVY